MVPLKHSEKSKLVEIPANWTLDDWPPFQWTLTQANSVSGLADNADNDVLPVLESGAIY